MTQDSDRLTEAIALIEKLVAFDTVSSKTNLPLIQFIDDRLRARGVRTFILPDKSGDKASIFASFGPATNGGVLLSGHSDVVPTDGQVWTSDPFRLRREGDRLYGRGACDMKGFVGAVLAMADEFLSAPLRQPIHILITYDEEVTCLGPVDAIERFGHSLPAPSCVIVGEPTSMKVADAHKSVSCYMTYVTGKEGHSSQPDLGASAIECACDLVLQLYRIADDFKSGSSRFDPPGSSISVGRIFGGTARNIIARDCAFEWEFRGEPQIPMDAAFDRFDAYVQAVALPRLKAKNQDATIHTVCEVSVPGLQPDPGSLAQSLALRLTKSNRTYAAAFATEAGRFQSAALPVVICGPGDIQQAHQPDEFIEISQIQACINFMRDLIQELSNG